MLHGPGHILIRADAGPDVGGGHALRCLALAQEWRSRGGTAAFLISDGSLGLEGRLRSEGFDVKTVAAAAGSPEDAALTAESVAAGSARWLILDGYRFGAEYQRVAVPEGVRLLCVDDSGRQRAHAADLLVDQNLGAERGEYPNARGSTRLLLGTRYAMLRREFVEPAESARSGGGPARVLVTLGSSDPTGSTINMARALASLGPGSAQAKIAISSWNPGIEQVKLAIDDANIKIVLEVDPLNMAQLMRWADLALSAAGSTCWELCRCGLPSLLIAVAENQRPLAERLSRIGFAVDLGWHADIQEETIKRELVILLGDPERLRSMASVGQRLVDGQGSARVVDAMLARGISFRRAASGDARLVWEWANDPDTREASFDTAPIPWETHEDWFAKKVVDPECVFLIACGEVLRHGHLLLPGLRSR
ncbi:MAG TPA: UDP-2,4-diacetamido-2,4,6-trideoxy-beta-L-altropyranose hydrolase, partial [Thermoplasmata archaeon]|nr:UDP-2,4-diacetamido-2,4,6-trideoxy-beta-L-altropyranose hydrolase [Thermoplasmata archaeon]